MTAPILDIAVSHRLGGFTLDAALQTHQAGDQIENGRFPRARRPEQGGDPLIGGERGIENEIAARQEEACLDHVKPAAR